MDGEGEILDEIPRPRTRGDCAGVPRPCPFVTCKYSTYNLRAAARAIANGAEPPDPTERDPRFSCTLDIADEGEATLEDVGRALGESRERVRQIEASARRKLAHPSRARHLEVFRLDGPEITRNVRPERDDTGASMSPRLGAILAEMRAQRDAKSVPRTEAERMA